jgi:DNA-binding SARP family transcriptional activator/tetratricopeptide (TPR) repeat protein
MDYRILGPLEVVGEGTPVALRGAKQRALLAILLLHANTVVPVERLIAELWDEQPPETASNTLQVYVSQLRKALGGAALETRSPGYELHVEPEELDLTRFTRLLAQAGGEPPAAAAATLRRALALWRGPALADLAFEPFARSEIARLEDMRLAALEDRIEADLALGRHGDVVGELEALTVEHPLRERFRAQLMLALYRSGRQAEALAAYQRTRTTLVDELGIEPGPELQRLEKAVLRQDPALDAPEQPAAAERPQAAREPEPARREARKTVTVLFASVAVAAQVDPEVLRGITQRALDAAAHVLRRHEATVESLAGTRLLAVFGVPTVHEDDALRAARAAAELRDRVAALNKELERESGVGVSVRVGVATGEVIVDPAAGAAAISGDAVTTAARLEQAAGAGEILIAESTERLLHDAVRAEANGAGGLRLEEVLFDAGPLPRRLDAPMVGREHELGQLRQAFEHAVRGNTCYLFTVLGAAGIGKSRLAAEFRSTLGADVAAVTGRSLPYGEGITFWPLVEIVKQAFGERGHTAIAELVAADENGAAIADHVAGAVGLTDRTSTPEEIFWAVRKLLEALARDRPLVVFLDDLHWAEPTFLDLVENLGDMTRDAPVLVVCLARPELLEERPSWAGGKPNATSILLEPLSDSECGALIDNLAEAVPADVRERITEAADGNPLFVEQMLAMLGENGGGSGDAQLSIPPTIHALLAARLDRLGDGERAVVERASVIGKEFWPSAIAELAGDESRADLGPALRTLVRKELIRPGRSSFFGEDAFRFRHHLIRDVAYESLPKGARAALHERFAGWLEEKAGERVIEYEEILGYHLEQAYRYQTELAPVDDAKRTLASRAAERLFAAGRRAYSRGDVPAAVSLLSRALALWPAEDRQKLELRLELGESLREVGELQRSFELLEETVRLATAAGAADIAAHASLTALRLRIQTDPQIDLEEGEAFVRRTIDILQNGNRDARALSKAWYLLAWTNWFRARAGVAEEALGNAIVAAREAGDDRGEIQALHLLTGIAYFGPISVGAGIALCREISESHPGHWRISLSTERAAAGLMAMAGQFDEARELVARDLAALEDLGLSVTITGAGELYARVHMLAGDFAAAEAVLRGLFELSERMADTSSLATNAAVLAQILYETGRLDEAMHWSEVSEHSAAESDLQTQPQWRTVRAKLLAAAGRLDEAERLARGGVAIAEQTDFLNMHGNALVDLATVLRAAGKDAEATESVEAAIALYERKGNVVSAAQARALL